MGKDNQNAAGGLFVVDEGPIVSWPVSIPVPADGGTFRHHVVEMRLRYTTAAILDGEMAKLQEGMTAEKLGTEEDPLFDKVHGWSGIGLQNDGELLFTEANKAKVLRHSSVRSGIVSALVEMSVGLPSKNSETLPAPGSAPNRKARRAVNKTRKKTRRSSKT